MNILILALYCPFHQTIRNNYSITVASTDSESSRPHLTLEPSQPAKKVQSITQWLSAFNIFVALYAEKQATDRPKLMKYCEIVHDIAAKPGNWLYYDEQFRFIRQSAPDQYPWDAIHWELWLKAVTNFPPKPLQIKGICAPGLNPFQKAPVGVSKPVDCAMDVGLTTYALNAAHCTLPHNVPLANNTKETPLRSALQLQPPKPVTPVKVDRLNFFLTGYHSPLRQFLVNGFSYGFRVGFVGNRRASQSPNLKSAIEQPQAVRSKLLKELEAGRIRGPFPHPPFLEFICSPLGIVPKKSLPNFV